MVYTKTGTESRVLCVQGRRMRAPSQMQQWRNVLYGREVVDAGRCPRTNGGALLGHVSRSPYAASSPQWPPRSANAFGL